MKNNKKLIVTLIILASIITISITIYVISKRLKKSKKVEGTNLSMDEIETRIVAYVKEDLKNNAYNRYTSDYFSSIDGKILSDAPAWFKEWYDSEFDKQGTKAKAVQAIVNHQVSTTTFSDFVKNAKNYSGFAHRTIDELFTPTEAIIVKRQLGQIHGITTFLS